MEEIQCRYCGASFGPKTENCPICGEKVLDHASTEESLAADFKETAGVQETEQLQPETQQTAQPETQQTAQPETQQTAQPETQQPAETQPRELPGIDELDAVEPIPEGKSLDEELEQLMEEADSKHIPFLNELSKLQHQIDAYKELPEKVKVLDKTVNELESYRTPLQDVIAYAEALENLKTEMEEFISGAKIATATPGQISPELAGLPSRFNTFKEEVLEQIKQLTKKSIEYRKKLDKLEEPGAQQTAAPDLSDYLTKEEIEAKIKDVKTRVSSLNTLLERYRTEISPVEIPYEITQFKSQAIYQGNRVITDPQAGVGYTPKIEADGQYSGNAWLLIDILNEQTNETRNIILPALAEPDAAGGTTKFTGAPLVFGWCEIPASLKIKAYRK